jgi:hypothetical protein
MVDETALDQMVLGEMASWQNCIAPLYYSSSSRCYNLLAVFNALVL